jgi:16S rRNA (guanine966-N2)-methyltransferase
VRIISGSKKGLVFNPPSRIRARPTTDRAKEALFNIIEVNFDFEGLNVLDLFAGTGNLSFECASRGAATTTAVDSDMVSTRFIHETAEKLGFDNLYVVRSDVFRFLKAGKGPFDLIFADPPYDSPRIGEILPLVLENNLLSDKGWLIIEHHSKLNLAADSLFDKRSYGQSAFSFFAKKT